VALALRLSNGASGSLKLDDFHSLHHARAADLHAFFTELRQDNHPPLSFLLLRAARAALGEEPWALRLPALLAGLGTLLFVWRIGARASCPAGRTAAALLLAASSMHVELSSDLRMYALLALACVGLLEGLLDALEHGRGAWRIALWTSVGLHTHYHFVYALAALGGVTAALTLPRGPERAAFRPCVLGFGLAGLSSAPWYLLGFPAQLAHGLAPGGSHASLGRLFEGFKSLVFWNVSAGGAGLRLLGLGASALVLALALLAAWAGLRRARADGRLAWPCLLSAAAVLVPALSWSAARLSSRAGYEWRYLAGALPAFCLLAGSEACARGALARARRAALALIVLVALLLSAANARDPGEEDYRDAVAWILARAGPGDAVVAADWQPRFFPHAMAWDYYARRAARGRELPLRLEHDATFSLVAPERLAEHARVFGCLRSLPPHCALLRTLRGAYPQEEVLAFGRSVYVHAFTRP
jgi:4-amino-4-deoxy-L-arabinose transferase-like glycosyltransferase